MFEKHLTETDTQTHTQQTDVVDYWSFAPTEQSSKITKAKPSHSLNSKIDFLKPFKNSLTENHVSKNMKPGHSGALHGGNMKPHCGIPASPSELNSESSSNSSTNSKKRSRPPNLSSPELVRDRKRIRTPQIDPAEQA